MLQKLREKTSGWIATVILGLLIVPFAFFGLEQYLFQRVDTYVAKIEAPPSWWRSAPSWWPASMLWQHAEVDANEFRQRFEQMRQAERQRQGEAFDVRAFESAANKRKLLDEMIDEQVLKLSADAAGVTVSDQRVQDEIRGMEVFSVNGQFNLDRYRLVLASQVPQLSPREFEAEVRDSLKQSLLPARIGESAFVSKGELDRLLRLLGEKREVGYVVLPPPSPDAAPVAEAEIAKWYRDHAARYRAPETVTLEYVEVDAASLPVAPPDEAALRQRYEQERTRFVASDQRLASHILVKVDPAADAAAQKAAEQKATQLAAQAKAPGADFAALARANSQDEGSAASGGDLGWVEKGVMVKAFEDALFAMKPGEVRGPVKTEFGWHVLQLRELKAGQSVPFEQVREQLATEVAASDRERAYNELTGKLVDLVYKNPTALAPAAREVNLPVKTLGPIVRGADASAGLAGHPALQRAAFSEALIQDGTVSDPIEIAPNHSVLVRVTAHTPQQARPLAQVRERIIAEIRADRAARALAATADAMLARLRGGAALQAVAAERQLVPVEVPAVQRGAPLPTPEASTAYFSVPAPAAGKVSAGKVETDDGGIVLFVVRKVIPGNPAEASPAEREMLQQQLARAAGGDDAKAFVAAKRKQMKVDVAEDRL
jgi:peptidyl-prolyl cis-trans isomerase D